MVKWFILYDSRCFLLKFCKNTVIFHSVITETSGTFVFFILPYRK